VPCCCAASVKLATHVCQLRSSANAQAQHASKQTSVNPVTLGEVESLVKFENVMSMSYRSSCWQWFDIN